MADEIEWTPVKVRLGDLSHWADNPVTLSKSQAKKLLRSKEKLGKMQTLAIGPQNGDGKHPLYDGHQRANVWGAAFGMGLEVWALQSSRALTDDERHAVPIMLRTAVGSLDWDALAGWTDYPLGEWGLDEDALQGMKFDIAALGNLLESEMPEPADAEPQIDRAEELNEKWQVKTGDLWRIGEHRLLCGDSTRREDVERVMQGERADCVFTSPPYAIGIDYGVYQDTIENLRAMLPTLVERCAEVITEGGFVVINFGDIANGRILANDIEPCEYPMALEYFPIFREKGWRLWTRRVWCKPNIRVYAPWTIQSNRAATDWEHIWTWVRHGRPLDIRNGAIDRDGWFDTTHDAGVDVGKEIHGAGMALGCAQRMVQVHSRVNTIVWEPFCGTGTTIVACQNLGRKCRAIEISPPYCAVTLERMATAFPGIEIARIA